MTAQPRPTKSRPTQPRGSPPRPAPSRAPGPGAAPPPPAPPGAVLPSYRFRVRLLPVTIFVAVLMLGVRLGDVWQAAVNGQGIDAVSAQAQAQTQTAQIQTAQAQTTAKGPAAPLRVAENPPSPAPAGPPPVPVSGEADTGRPLALGKEQRVSPADLELLQHLSERRNGLDRRAREIEQREALLIAAEQRFDQKVSELQKLRQEIQKLLRTVDEKQQAQLESLVKIYETMKPKEAARIFEALDLPVLLDVMERMKESKTAPILASMDPVKAKEVTIALVDRRQLPQLPSQ